jgi:hypothetical protein
MFDMGPNDDLRSWAMRMAHFGVLGGLLGLALAVLLFFQSIYLMGSVMFLRSQIKTLQKTLDNALSGAVQNEPRG